MKIKDKKSYKAVLIAKYNEFIESLEKKKLLTDNHQEIDKKIALLKLKKSNVENNFVEVQCFMNSWINKNKELDEQQEEFTDYENLTESVSNYTQIIKYKNEEIFKSK